jgi:chromate transporter
VVDHRTHLQIPPEPLGRLFWRYLRFGLLAWGGPVAQIALIRQELVEEKRWVSPDHFNRVLAVYQVLPGPEAHEMCVYFGMLSRGRLGGLLAGLGFMLPGFVLMLLLSALYAAGPRSEALARVSLGVAPAVAALVVRAVHRIGKHALVDRWLWILACVCAVGALLGASFWLTLPLAGLAYLAARRSPGPAAAVVVVLAAAVLAVSDPRLWSGWDGRDGSPTVATDREEVAPFQRPSPLRLFLAGLRSGLLTFGGAYTVLPFLRHDAVEVGRWLTDAQFLDGVALSSLLPAPFVIFSTFVGYLGGGLVGAVLLTAGVFLPAFAFTLLGHRHLERLIEHPGAHGFLDGVTAGVVGLIAATAVEVLRAAVGRPEAAAVFVLSLAGLYLWKAKGAVAAIVAAAGLAGWAWTG